MHTSILDKSDKIKVYFTCVFGYENDWVRNFLKLTVHPNNWNFLLLLFSSLFIWTGYFLLCLSEQDLSSVFIWTSSFLCLTGQVLLFSVYLDRRRALATCPCPRWDESSPNKSHFLMLLAPSSQHSPLFIVVTLHARHLSQVDNNVCFP